MELRIVNICAIRVRKKCKNVMDAEKENRLGHTQYATPMVA